MAVKTRPPKRRNQNGSHHQLLPISNTALLTPFRFLDLPAEIRNMVYMEAFGGKRIHLCNMIHKFGNIRHYICPDDISSHCNCYGAERARYLLEYNTRNCQKVTSYISRLKLNANILRTCQQIYDEAVSILYASNTFDVNRKAPFQPFFGEKRYPEIELSPLFEFTGQVRPPYLNCITRLEISWFFQYVPTVDEMGFENRISRSARTWSAHWGRIGRKFPNLCELVVRLIFESLMNWVAGGYMFWALPMLKSVRGLRSCEIYVEHSDDRLISLDDLAAVMCSELSSPEDAAACVQKARHDYPTREQPPSFPAKVYVEILSGVSEWDSWLFPGM